MPQKVALRLCAALLAIALAAADAAGSIAQLSAAASQAEERGDFKAALRLHRAVISQAPSDVFAHAGAAMALARTGELQQGLASMRIAVALGQRGALQPAQLAGLEFNLGYMLMQAGDARRAGDAFQAASVTNPKFREAHLKAAQLLRDAGDPSRVVAHLRAAIELEPRNPNAYAYLAQTLNNLKRWKEAIELYQQALKLEPRDADSRISLAETLLNSKRYKEAAKQFTRAAKARETPAPLRPKALVGLLHARSILADWKGWARLCQLVEQATGAELRQGKPTSLSPYQSLFTWLGNGERRMVAASWSKMHRKEAAELMSAVSKHMPSSASGGKVRVGYLSRRFEDYAGTHLLLPIFAAHNRARTHVVAIARGPDDRSAERKQIQRDADEWHDLSSATTPAAVAAIRAMDLDVIIDYDGIHNFNNLKELHMGLARKSCTWLGFAGTTGGNLDCLIADNLVVPREFEEDFSETIVRLPYSYQPAGYRGHRSVGPKTTRAAHGLGSERPAVCSFNRVEKMDPTTFRLWASIAVAANATLWIMDNPAAREQLTEEAAAAGLPPSQLVLAPKLPKDQHLARLGICSLVLDSTNYGAHTTATDALFVGTPIVTVPAEVFSSRVSASLLVAAGLGSSPLICGSVKEEEDVAVATLADAGTLRAAVSAATTTSPLFDFPRFAAGMEATVLSSV